MIINLGYHMIINLGHMIIKLGHMFTSPGLIVMPDIKIRYSAPCNQINIHIYIYIHIHIHIAQWSSGLVRHLVQQLNRVQIPVLTI